MAEHTGERTLEVSTVGIDEALAGLSTDPFGGANPTTMGLRVPAFIPANGERYLFLLASVEVADGTCRRIRGWRQYVTIGYNGSTGSPPSVPVELPVTTPNFRFPDGDVSWHLVREGGLLGPAYLHNPPTNLPSFAFVDSSTPALLYQTASFSAPSGYYMLNMTGYTAPRQRLGTWEPIGGLGNVRGIRAPWDDAHAWDSLDITVIGQARISLYASVRQTNPATRPAPIVVAGGPPEDAFIAAVNADADLTSKVIFWRVAGSLIVEDVPMPIPIERQPRCRLP